LFTIAEFVVLRRRRVLYRGNVHRYAFSTRGICQIKSKLPVGIIRIDVIARDSHPDSHEQFVCYHLDRRPLLQKIPVQT
jgi:hypothetical protein